MSVTPGARAAEQVEERTPEQEERARAVGVWVHHFARTLKTCRLYDANNPTVIRFRADLSQALGRLLAEHGPVSLRFTSEDVLCEGKSLYPARSRDDNLALPFFQDGVRGLEIRPGAEVGEIETVVDSVLLVTNQAERENDLVTILWEASLQHIEVDYVPAEGDVGQGATPEEGEALLPWPTPAPEEPATDPAPGDTTVEAVESGPKDERSDDWTAGDLTVEIEAGFEELEALSGEETRRFMAEYEEEHQVPLLTTTLAIAQAYLAAGATPEDRTELARFLARLLRQAVAQGSWVESWSALKMLGECGITEWSSERFVQELAQPISISNLVERLDSGEDGVTQFIGFTGELGDPALELLNLVLAESKSRKCRRALAEAIALKCREHPERLAPWIADPRWFVVRNVVHILGWIGGPGIVGLLQAAMRNPDPRVRLEVAASLGQVEPRMARPLLIRLLDGADSRLLQAVLYQLSASRDTGVARLMLGMMQNEAFDERPAEEKRSIYSALASTADDVVLPELEAELHKGGWFDKNQEAHRQSVARVIARIGTPAARLCLERGVASKRPPVRKACEDAMVTFHDHE